MFLYIVRHGQSASNAVRRHSGQDNAPLTEKGIEDAKRAGERLAGIRFDRVYASDQLRAMQTAKNALPLCEPILDRRIREIDVGTLTGQLIDDCRAKYGEYYDEIVRERHFSAFAGEDHRDQYERVIEFIKMLEKTDCENVAVFTHGGAINCFIEYALGIPMSERRIKVENGSVTVFEYADGKWRLCLR